MKVKVFTHNLKVSITDDLIKATDYFKSKGITVEFTTPEETNISLVDAPVKLYKPLDGTFDHIMYIFDRYNDNRAYSFALSFSTTLEVSEISTSTFDDAIGYTAVTIMHEVMHSFFHRLHRKGIDIYDCMDSTIVNGVMVPYYLNDQPYNPKSNFSIAFKALQPYWSLLFNEKQMYKYFSAAEVATWGLNAPLWEKLDKAREYAGVAFKITSGRRSPSQNTSAGGAKQSTHLTGDGCDISCTTSQNRLTMMQALLKAGFTRIGVYPKHLHADLGGSDYPQNVMWVADKD